jgi:hypothetical protein
MVTTGWFLAGFMIAVAVFLASRDGDRPDSIQRSISNALIVLGITTAIWVLGLAIVSGPAR